MIEQEEIDELAKEYIRLRDKSEKNSKYKKEFEEFQNFMINRLSQVVIGKISRYRKFSNYPDLVQDGFEALMLSLKTYDPKKGSFAWWMHKYINTRISRKANNHSTIQIPLKKAKTLQPYKVSVIPEIISTDNPHEFFEDAECGEIIREALDKLPEDQKKVIMLAFDFEGDSSSISSISREMKLSRVACVDLLDEATKSLKNILQEKL